MIGCTGLFGFLQVTQIEEGLCQTGSRDIHQPQEQPPNASIYLRTLLRIPTVSMNSLIQVAPQSASATAADTMAEPEPQTPTTPTTPLAPATPETDASPFASPEPKYEEPLYTEINIPLPPLPKQKPSPKSRSRAHTLHSLKPFHRRGSSSDSTSKGEEWPRIKKEVKSKEVAAAMNLTTRHRRSGTVDALAVVPAVLMLSAELFTPGEGVKRKNGGKWEDGMI